MKTFWTDWTYWLVLFTWLPWGAFVAYYGVKAPRWWSTSIGRGIMTPALAMVTLLTFGLINRMFDLPDAAGVAVRVASFTSVIVAGWLLLFALVAEQHRVRRDGCPKRRATDVEVVLDADPGD